MTCWNLWIIWRTRRIAIVDFYCCSFHVDCSINGRAGGVPFVTKNMKMPGVEKCMWAAWEANDLNPEQCLKEWIAYHVEAVTAAKQASAPPPVSDKPSTDQHLETKIELETSDQ